MAEEAAFFTPLPTRPMGRRTVAADKASSRRQAARDGKGREGVIHTSFAMRKPRRRKGNANRDLVESHRTEICSCGILIVFATRREANNGGKEALIKPEAASFNLTTLTLSPSSPSTLLSFSVSFSIQFGRRRSLCRLSSVRRPPVRTDGSETSNGRTG